MSQVNSKQTKEMTMTSKRTLSHILVLAAAIAAMFILPAGAARAATVTWDTVPGTVGGGDSAITGGDGTWDLANGNWTIDGGLNNVAWVNGNNDTAVFGGAAGTVTLGAGVQVGGLQFNTAGYTITSDTLTFGVAGNIVTNADATISSLIAGSVAIAKTGTGVLTLSGANTYTGTTTVSAGTLAYGANDVISTGAVTVNGTGAVLAMGSYSDSVGAVTLTAGDITGSGTLTSTSGFTMNNAAATSASVVLDGAVALTKTGAGVLTLSGANTYTGTTTVSAGVLRAADGIGLPTNSLLSLNGGVLETSGNFTRTIANAAGNYVYWTGNGGFAAAGGALNVNLNGGATIDWNAVGGFNAKTLILGSVSADDVVTISNNIDMKGNRTVQVDDNTGTTADYAVLAGIIANGDATARNLTKTGAGTLVLSAANTYTGTTTVSAGTLRLGIAGAIPSVSAVTVSSGTLDLANYDQTLSAATALTMGGTAGVTPAVTTGTGTLTLGGNVTYSATNNGLGSTISGKLDLGSANRTFTIGNSTNAADDMAISADISGAGGLIKAGAGTLTLSGANIYTGTTTVNAGALRATGTALPGSLLQLGGGVLETNGTFARTVGTGAGQVQWTAAGGFAAQGGSLDVQLNGVTTTFDWSTINQNLIFGSVSADGVVTVKNSQIDMKGNRTITVNDNTATTADYAVIEGIIADGDATARTLTKAGAGLLVLSAANTYTGTTTVSAGTLAYGADNVIYTGAVTVNGAGAVLAMGSYSDRVGLVTLTAGDITGSGTLTSTSGFTMNNAAAASVSVALAGSVGLTKTGAGTLTLSGANSYTGNTTINAGAIQFSTLGAISGTGRNVELNSGGAVVFGSAFGAGNIPTVLSTRIVAASAGAIAADNYASTNFDFGAAGLTGASLGAVGNVTYTGALTPNGTTYRLGGGGGTLTISSNLGDSGGATSLSKVGTNTVILAGANSFTGATTVRAGTLQYNSPAAIGSTSAINPSTGTIIALAYDANQAALTLMTGNTNAFTVALAANDTNALDFSAATGANLSNASLGATGAFTYSGALTPYGTTYRLGGGGGTLTFNPTSYVSGDDLVINGGGISGTVNFAGLSKTFGAVTSSGGTIQNGTLTGTSFGIDAGTVSAVLAGAGAGLTKATTGTLTLNGAAVNTYTGATTVNRGTLIADFVNLTSATNLINSASALVMGSGTLQVKQKSATVTSQTFSGTTINAGGSAITATNTAGSGTLTLTVALGGISRNAGGVVNFTLPTSGQGNITTSTANDATGILGRWATTGLTTSLQYAANSGGNIIVYTGATAATAGTLTNMNSAATNYSFAAAATIPFGYVLTGNTLRYTGAAATLEIGNGASNSNTLTLNGLMQAGSGALTISRTGTDATGGLVIGASNELVIVTNNQAMTISAPIMNNGATPGAVTFATFGNGQLTLTGASSFSGGLTIASGQLNTQGPLASGSDFAVGSGLITIRPGAILQLSRNTLANAFDVTDGTIQTGNSFGSTVSGNIVVTGTATLMHNNGSGNIAYTGNISGTGGVLSLGTREDSQLGVTLSGTNTFAGPATVGANATVRFSNRVSLPNTGSWTADNLVVEAGGAAYFMVGGTGQFTAADIDILKTLGTDTGGFKNGSYLGLENAAAFAYTSVIADTNGGANKLGFKKFGAGVLTLGNNNTYTGPTYLHAGTTEVSSLNSVVGGTASSSLGAPKTVADGTIVLNPYGPTITLKYVGAGETTDRMINAKGSLLILDQSGSGLLKFTGDIYGTNNTATFTLQGSTAGTAEFAGTIGGTTASKIVKSGTGTWTLSGNNAFTGGVTINAGTLQLGSAGALNSTPGLENAVVFGASSTGTLALGGNSVTVANLQTNATPGTTYVQNANGSAVANATLTVGNSTNASGTFAGTIRDGAGGGTLGLTKAGAGTLTLTGASTFTGATLVSGGRLQLDGLAAGTLTSGLTVGAGATLGFTAGTASTLDLTGKPFSLGGTVALDIGGAGGNDALTVGDFTLTGDSAFTFTPIGGITSGATYTLLTSTNDITTNGFGITGLIAGRLTLAPTINAKTVTLTPVLDEGVWNQTGGGIWSDGDPNATGGNWTNYKPTVVGDAALFGSAITGPATITVDMPHTAGWLRFDNTNAVTIGSTGSSNLTLNNGAYTAMVVVNSGSHIIAENVLLTSSVVVSPASGATLTVSGNLTGAGGVQLGDAGKLVLSGDNTYTGPTTINAGTLQLDGNTAVGSTVAIGTAAALTGSGTVKGNATIAGDGIIDFGSTGRIVGTLGVTGGNWNGLGSVGGKITTTAGEFTIPVGATLNVGDLVGANRALELQGSSTVNVEGTLNVHVGSNLAVRDAGTLIVTGTVNTSGMWIPVASNSTGNPTATIILEGSGQWNHTYILGDIGFVIGESGTVRGELIIRDDAQLNSSFMRMATWGATTWGVVYQDGGTVTLDPTVDEYISVGAPALRGAMNGQAEYHLNGGVLNCGLIGALSGSSGSSRFYFNGGTLVPNTDDFVPGSIVSLYVNQDRYMQRLNQVIVQAGGAKIDTNGHSITIAQNLEHDPNAPAIDGGLTKLGAGTLILHGAGDSTYTGPTAVNTGTLVARNAGALKATSGVTVDSGAALEYRAAADAPLAIGGTLTVTGGAGTVIGTSIGADANSASINVAGKATIIDGAHAVNIHVVPGVTHATGRVTLVHADGAGSSLNPATVPTLGAVYNNTDFTIDPTAGDGGTQPFTRTATDIQVDIISATPLTGAYWTGGLAGNTNVWCVSNGTTASNWVTAAGGGATALVPGAGADVVISANSVATAPTATVLGANMTIKTLTISDTANGLGINADDYALTITPTDPGTGITMTAGVPASTIAANVVLGAAQTWTNNSASALTVSGAISGTVGLTKAGTGTLILSGDNPYTGDTTVSAGTLKLPYEWAVQNSTVIMGGGTAAVVFDSAETANAFWFGGLAAPSSGAGYDIALQNNDPNTLAIALTVGSNGASTTYAGVLSGGGSLTKRGAGTFTLSNAASTYAGATNIAAGMVIVSKLADGGQPSSIGASANAYTNLLLGNGTTLKYVGAGDSTDRLFTINGTAAGHGATLDASGSGPIVFTNTGSLAYGTGNQTRTLNLIGANTGANTLAAVIGNNGTSAVSVVKDGPGTWVLTGASTYTGATTINAGTLLVNNSIGTGAVTVNSGATLGGYGTIGGAVTVNAGGTVAPGDGVGALTAGGNFAMTDGSIYEWQLAGKSVGQYDSITAASINLTGLITFEIDKSLFGGSVSVTDSFVVASATTGIITNSATFDLILPSGWSGGTLAVSEGSKELILSGLSSLIPGDTNGDKVVDAADFINLKKNFGKSGGVAQGDFNASGTVNWADLGILMSNMGTGGGAPATTPEPATLGLLALGALAVIRRRRKA
jgi:autotransporter-associated beta strand protein